jgi:uncharacterized membrane protein
MKISEASFSKRSSKIKPIIFAVAVLSFIGFLDATYLAAKYYLGDPVTCSVFGGCEEVTTGKYAEMFGVSVALLGAFYYLTIFLSSIFYLDSGRKAAASFIGYFTIVGLLASSWFVYLQLFVINAICLYCMISAATSTILFILGMFMLLRLKARKA